MDAVHISAGGLIDGLDAQFLDRGDESLLAEVGAVGANADDSRRIPGNVPTCLTDCSAGVSRPSVS